MFSFYLVSRLLNFFVITLPGSKPSRAQINFVNSGCDEPPNTLILGILGHNDGRFVNLPWWVYECWLESEFVRVFKDVSSSWLNWLSSKKFFNKNNWKNFTN